MTASLYENRGQRGDAPGVPEDGTTTKALTGMNGQAMVRVVSGVLMLVYSAMMIFEWLPSPRTPEATAFLAALEAAGYVYPMIYVSYAVIGICFLVNRFVTLATFALVPLTLNVGLYHGVLSPRTLPATLLLVIPLVSMMLVRREEIASFLRPDA